MSKIKRIIPFSWTPASWGLVGPAYEQAEAYYNYDGIDLEYALAKIEYGDDHRALAVAERKIELSHGIITQEEYETDLHHLTEYADPKEEERFWLTLELKFHRITAEEYDYSMLDLQEFENDVDQELAKLELDHKYNKITDSEYEKAKHTALGLPWFDVVESGLNEDSESVLEGYFELDWNDIFVMKIQDGGFVGESDADIVNKWFNAICNVMRMQEEADQDYGMQNGGPVTPGRAGFDNDVIMVRDNKGDDNEAK